MLINATKVTDRTSTNGGSLSLCATSNCVHVLERLTYPSESEWKESWWVGPVSAFCLKHTDSDDGDDNQQIQYGKDETNYRRHLQETEIIFIKYQCSIAIPVHSKHTIYVYT